MDDTVKLFELVLIALACPLLLPFVVETEQVGNPDRLEREDKE